MDSEELLTLFPQLDPDRALHSSWPSNPQTVDSKAELLGIFGAAIKRRGINEYDRRTTHRKTSEG